MPEPRPPDPSSQAPMEVLDGSLDDSELQGLQQDAHQQLVQLSLVTGALIAAAAACCTVVSLSKIFGPQARRLVTSAWRRSVAGKAGDEVASPPPLQRLHGDLQDNEPIVEARWKGPGAPATPNSAPFSLVQEVLSVGKSTGSPGKHRSPHRQMAGGGLDVLTPVQLATGSKLQAQLQSAGRQVSRSKPFSSASRSPRAVPSSWDPRLLEESRQREFNISSVAGLEQSRDFHSYMRDKHGNLDLYLSQAAAKLDTYRHLRAFDREGFLHALTRRSILEVESGPTPRPLALLELFLTGAITYCAFLGGALGTAYGWGPLLLWALAHAVFAWPYSHTSLIGRVLSIYSVQGCPGYPDHTLSAPMWRTASAAVLEAFFTCLTFGLSLLVSAGLTFATPQRQTCGQLLTRTYAVRETSRPVSVPIYSTTPSTSMSPVSREQHHLSDQQGVSGGHRRPFSSAKPTSSGHEWQTPDGDVPEFSGWRAAAAGKSPARRSSIDVADPASVLAHHAGSQPGLPGTAAPSVQPPTRSPVVRMGTGITNTVNNTSGIFGRVASRLGNIGHATSPSVAARPSAGDVGVSYPPYGSPSLAAGLAPGSAQQQMRARRPLPPDGQVIFGLRPARSTAAAGDPAEGAEAVPSAHATPGSMWTVSKRSVH